MIYIWSMLTGIVLGSIFTLLKLPIPAPSTLAGVLGILGVYIGYVITSKFM
ncbi:MAG: DUF1427 family protein [Candidatus Gastranaerophilales bacterium]|nr:DUF1427 family protein [Candidatus Gastranaerophilales bacterium]